jgi:hypothetical protein
VQIDADAATRLERDAHALVLGGKHPVFGAVLDQVIRCPDAVTRVESTPAAHVARRIDAAGRGDDVVVRAGPHAELPVVEVDALGIR